MQTSDGQVCGRPVSRNERRRYWDAQLSVQLGGQAGQHTQDKQALRGHSPPGDKLAPLLRTTAGSKTEVATDQWCEPNTFHAAVKDNIHLKLPKGDMGLREDKYCALVEYSMYVTMDLAQELAWTIFGAAYWYQLEIWKGQNIPTYFIKMTRWIWMEVLGGLTDSEDDLSLMKAQLHRKHEIKIKSLRSKASRATRGRLKPHPRVTTLQLCPLCVHVKPSWNLMALLRRSRLSFLSEGKFCMCNSSFLECQLRSHWVTRKRKSESWFQGVVICFISVEVCASLCSIVHWSRSAGLVSRRSDVATTLLATSSCTVASDSFANLFRLSDRVFCVLTACVRLPCSVRAWRNLCGRHGTAHGERWFRKVPVLR